MALQTGVMLVVDDDQLSRVMLSSQLTMEGYTVFVAEHGRDAIQMLHDQPFDMVLLDLLMPEVDGFQVLEHMKADDILRHMPVIVISALDEMGSVVRIIQMGATDHLIKPCDPFLLRARINASLTAKRLHDQEAEYRRQVALLTRAAANLEMGTFELAELAPVAERSDALGQLARVFQRMAHEVAAREQDLQQQNRFKSALIGKITHELRSPFVAAGLSVQVLQRYTEHHMIGQMREELRLLDRQLSQGRKMIDNAIAFASLVSKQANFHLKETDIASLIQSVTAPLQQLAETRGIVITYDLAPVLPAVRVDRERMSEAIQHLVHNAIKFNHEHGMVRIGCWSSETELIFSVVDSGPGIAPDKLELIWEAFTQTSDDVQRGVEGLGLGLALVKYVAEAHSGTVFAWSTPDEGSALGFHIPLV